MSRVGQSKMGPYSGGRRPHTNLGRGFTLKSIEPGLVVTVVQVSGLKTHGLAIKKTAT